MGGAVMNLANKAAREADVCSGKLLAIPSKAAPVLVGLSTVAIKARLDDLVCEALDELSADT